VLWGHSPSCAKVERGGWGVRWLWVGGGGCAYLLPGAPPASPFVLHPLPSPHYPLLTLLIAH